MLSPGFLSNWEASRVFEWSTLLVLQENGKEQHILEVQESVRVYLTLKCLKKQKQKNSSLVVSLPELDRTDIRSDENGAAQKGIEGGGEDCWHYSLDKQHGRVWWGLRSRSFDNLLQEKLQPQKTEKQNT